MAFLKNLVSISLGPGSCGWQLPLSCGPPSPPPPSAVTALPHPPRPQSQVLPVPHVPHIPCLIHGQSCLLSSFRLQPLPDHVLTSLPGISPLETRQLAPPWAPCPLVPTPCPFFWHPAARGILLNPVPPLVRPRASCLTWLQSQHPPSPVGPLKFCPSLLTISPQICSAPGHTSLPCWSSATGQGPCLRALALAAPLM